MLYDRDDAGMTDRVRRLFETLVKDSAAAGYAEYRTHLTDLRSRSVVRHGLMSMPRLTRVELTDAELASIAAYLPAGKPR
jgi:hypothetical protein